MILSSARPDFHLSGISASIGAVVLLANHEFEHRCYRCELKRCLEIAAANGNEEEQMALPILYRRFNPHQNVVDGVYYDLKLEEQHDIVVNNY